MPSVVQKTPLIGPRPAPGGSLLFTTENTEVTEILCLRELCALCGSINTPDRAPACTGRETFFTTEDTEVTEKFYLCVLCALCGSINAPDRPPA